MLRVWRVGRGFASRGLALLGVLLLSLALPSAALADEPQATKTVLSLFEETRLLASVAATDDAIRTTLQAGPMPIRLYTEYLGLSWFPEGARELALRDLLEKTYSTRKPDVVIVWGTSALRFALTHRAALFRGVPIVFCAADPALLPRLDNEPAVTGVARQIDWSSSLDLMLRLHPETSEVAIVTGAGAVDRRWETDARRAFADYRGSVKLTYLARLPMPRLVQAVESLSKNTVILYGAVLQDGAGRPYLPREALALVAKASRVPIYAVTENALGHGIVGGRLLDFPSHGVTAAKLALRILGGEQLGHEDIVTAENPYLFDWRQLRRWRIDEDRLPPGSVVRFREASVWDLYRGYIVAAVILIAAQSLLIAALLVQRAQRQRAEDDARRHLGELAHAQRVATLGELAASLAHEINQPLAAITTNAQTAHRLLSRPGPARDELSETVVDIASDAKRAADIVRRLRALIHKLPLEYEPVDVNALVTEMTSVLRRELEQNNITVQLHLVQGLPAVLGDAVQLRQVVLNLLVNACHAMAHVEDGPRLLRIETSEPKFGHIGLTVADTGPGVPEPDLEQIFKPFVSSKPRGLGLGLAITRSIIEAHGGRTWAALNPDGGLTLHVALPSTNAEPPVLHDDASTREPGIVTPADTAASPSPSSR